MPKLKRAVSVDQLIRKKFIDIPLPEGPLKDLLGTPERSGSWFVFGESGNGKTTFLMQMAKILASLPKTKVVYNTLEEGARKSMQAAVEENCMWHVKSSFQILDKEPIPELRQRLAAHKSPNICFIDSVQYAHLDKRSYKALISDFNKKLFIFNSHAQGKRPVGAIGRDILFDADIKIRVKGFVAFAKSRLSRGKKPRPYIIWDQGARDYWGDLQIDEWKKA
jgi:energy-coupling factor transporter ATP-binding protein EcfA2